MNLTLSVDDEIVHKARQRAEALSTSLNQLVREYLEQIAGINSPQENAAEFTRLSLQSNGNSRGWKFNREELHVRNGG